MTLNNFSGTIIIIINGSRRDSQAMEGTATREWKKDWTKEVWNVNWPDEQMQSMGGNLATIWVADTNDSKYEMITLLRYQKKKKKHKKLKYVG